MRFNFADTPYKSPEEFKKMVLDHVRNNLEIICNENEIITIHEDGFVKLGHETNVIFKVSGIPKEIHSIFLKNTSFKNIYKSKSALGILKNGFEKNHFILNPNNNHQVRVFVEENTFVLEKEASTASLFSNIYFYVAFIALLIFLVVLLFHTNFKRNRISYST
ncbi:hypothetical protein [Aquimarina pacifica]|uniref:hypothetical protein n=1 Tax=Aquimarina pacifica TaxID=1296415 RepID=UPI0004AED2C9|nr:hypothetical protein [Aquimarina pacifica]